MVHVQPVPALEDNYMYIISNEKSKEALIVDPVEPQKILDECKKNGLKVVGALITHHHWDHAGGTPELRKLVPDEKQMPIYGGDSRIDHMTHEVKHEENLETAGLKIRCFSTPCHTKGHICYYVRNQEEGDKTVFTGDTLFIAGCGKFFEGTADQMHKNLNEILSALPDETKVYPGHEYTTSNLKFAHHIEPGNKEISAKLDWSKKRDVSKIPTVPSTIGEEKQINPFMRVGTSEEIRKNIATSDLIEGMAKLREAKNGFRPKM